MFGLRTQQTLQESTRVIVSRLQELLIKYPAGLIPAPDILQRVTHNLQALSQNSHITELDLTNIASQHPVSQEVTYVCYFIATLQLAQQPLTPSESKSKLLSLIKDKVDNKYAIYDPENLYDLIELIEPLAAGDFKKALVLFKAELLKAYHSGLVLDPPDTQRINRLLQATVSQKEFQSFLKDDEKECLKGLERLVKHPNFNRPGSVALEIFLRCIIGILETKLNAEAGIFEPQKLIEIIQLLQIRLGSAYPLVRAKLEEALVALYAVQAGNLNLENLKCIKDILIEAVRPFMHKQSSVVSGNALITLLVVLLSVAVSGYLYLQR